MYSESRLSHQALFFHFLKGRLMLFSTFHFPFSHFCFFFILKETSQSFLCVFSWDPKGDNKSSPKFLFFPPFYLLSPPCQPSMTPFVKATNKIFEVQGHVYYWSGGGSFKKNC